MPGPLSDTVSTAGIAGLFERQTTVPPRGRELDRVREEMPRHLAEARRIAEHRQQRRVGELARDEHTLRLCRREWPPQSPVDGFDERHGTAVETKLAGQRLRDVEQVAGQLCLQPDVALDRFQPACRRRRVELAVRSRWSQPSTGVERRAQLVGNRREELVLHAAGGFRFAPRHLGLVGLQLRHTLRARRNSETRASGAAPAPRRARGGSRSPARSRQLPAARQRRVRRLRSRRAPGRCRRATRSP
jgi:hypothetical protein